MASKKKNKQPEPKGQQPGEIPPHHQRDHFADIGPTSIEGVEAHDLPDQGRGPVETDISKEAKRLPPDRTGGQIGGETGMRGDPEVVQAKARGHRKRS